MVEGFSNTVEISLNVVIHLGGFHTLMSYTGSIGTLMDGSGLEAVLQTIYGENPAKHMLHGKAIVRATRGHILVEAALTIKLQNMLCDDEDGNPIITGNELKQIKYGGSQGEIVIGIQNI